MTSRTGLFPQGIFVNFWFSVLLIPIFYRNFLTQLLKNAKNKTDIDFYKIQKNFQIRIYSTIFHPKFKNETI